MGEAFWPFFQLALFVAALVALGVWVWRLVHTRSVTALVCPRCGGRTAFGPSRPDIICRHCREPLRRGGKLEPGVVTETFHPVGRRDQ
ncbi:MAG TPA: hypothetical protein VF282_02220 [Bacillota bacterium]